MTSDLLQQMPSDKCDLRAAESLISLGYPAVAPVLPQLLEWIQDGNWPVARVIAPFLTTIGEPLVPHARQILSCDDDTWKYFFLETVVAKSSKLRTLLRPELERVADRPTESEAAEGLDPMARAMLAIA